MKLDKDKVIERVRELYEAECGVVWDGFKAPEQRIRISRQIKAAVAAMCEAINATSKGIDSE